MNQSIIAFSDYASGTAAIGSAATDGMTIYDQSTNALFTYNGSAWLNSTPGLMPVYPGTVTAAGGSATVAANGVLTITSAATSVALDGVFTSVYNNYRIIIDADVSSTGGNMSMGLRASGATNSAASYDKSHMYSTNGGTPAGAGSSGGTSWGNFGTTISLRHKHILELQNPAVAKNTTGFMNLDIGFASTVEVGTAALAHRVASAFDGIIFNIGTNGITGTIRIYGYN